MSGSVTPWTVARQALLSMGMLQARILEWVAISPPGDIPDPGIESWSPALQADSLRLSHQGNHQRVTPPAQISGTPLTLLVWPPAAEAGLVLEDSTRPGNRESLGSVAPMGRG